ncbi:DUF2911 domain-containing protein [Meridianimaribacter flavus]|uniref:DUF2911 domain-containing protein n=1 Tax=Meridianimaribacter flavus TaxID=571115 RepID=A0ABY2G941_9FLAO|nr:DUF2911 domain-containing protein [Meridianimaribacter flavus]TDY14349.1 Protein of unknown function (DUF2911) [Meridianimaribacter flavus]
MKKVMNLSKLACLAILLVSFSMNAQDFKDLDKSPMDAAAFPSSHRVSEKTVKVIYSRPQLKGRTVQSLAPNGEVWRTGANEATEITFYKDVTVGDKKVKAGTYSLFTIPGEKSWTIIINSDVDVWGAYSYNKDNDVARVEAPVSEGKKSLEAFSIAFDDEGSMHLAWGTLRVAVPMK